MYFSNAKSFKSLNGYEIDGVWYPRVTAIVGIKAKPALYKFYADQESFKAAESVKNISAEEGSLLHETIEGILKGEKVVIPDPIKPAIDAFLNFLSKNKVVPIRIEERLVSKNHRYAGTMDMLAELNGRLGVVDIKTSYAIYRDYNIQTSAYVEALKENPNLPDLTRWILRVDQAQACLKCPAKLRIKGGGHKIRCEKGKCDHEWAALTGEVELRELADFNNDIKAFLAAKTLWEWENEYWLRQVGY